MADSARDQVQARVARIPAPEMRARLLRALDAAEAYTADPVDEKWDAFYALLDKDDPARILYALFAYARADAAALADALT